MHIIDLTHKLSSDMPVFDESERPNIKTVTTTQKDGFQITNLNIYTHNGTHIDAPSHIINGGKNLSDFSIEKFIGTAAIIHCKNIKNNLVDLSVIKISNINFTAIDFIIFNTGSYKDFYNSTYLTNYSVLSTEAAKFLASLNLKGIGFDTISPDAINSHSLPIHNIFLEKDFILIENLTNLDDLPKYFKLSIFPLSYDKADGSPVRACAILE